MTVDKTLLKAANDAVAAGWADSLSSWVNLALAERAAKQARLSALSGAIAAFELEFGEISNAEIAAQARADDGAAVVVRGRPARRRKQAAA